MATSTRIVRFYEPIAVDAKGNTRQLPKGFWTGLFKHLATQSPVQLRNAHYGVTYHGEVRNHSKGKYLYVGRLRDLADNPNEYDPSTGLQGQYALPKKANRFSEGTWLVPFGLKNYVAVMSPISGPTRSTTLASWVTAMTTGLPSGDSIELRPIVDSKTLAKIKKAQSAKKLSVRIDDATQLPNTSNGFLKALKKAQAEATPGMSVELTLSYGRSSSSGTGGDMLRSAAEELALNHLAEFGSVILEVPDGNRLRSEAHDLVRDNISVAAKFAVAAGAPINEAAVLDAISDAIKQFRAR